MLWSMFRNLWYITQLSAHCNPIGKLKFALYYLIISFLWSLKMLVIIHNVNPALLEQAAMWPAAWGSNPIDYLLTPIAASTILVAVGQGFLNIAPDLLQQYLNCLIDSSHNLFVELTNYILYMDPAHSHIQTVRIIGYLIPYIRSMRLIIYIISNGLNLLPAVVSTEEHAESLSVLENNTFNLERFCSTLENMAGLDHTFSAPRHDWEEAIFRGY